MGKFEEITREDLLVEADRFGVRRAKDLLADVRGALENWTTYANEAKLGMGTTGKVSIKDFRLL